ncbi:adenine deaminase C-terminal domain-containing protein [Desulfosarcina sp.]|uniref:adenine deaminase C-terminal domain-containing protein n=1 Tax=Desulfosarcina sp. TaxID=2027861 RepID=UPI0029BB2234|nr:adenine deaminase C-terminal domain-containing protein [Desulfosarcina sp.]MDX2451227.1 adenine deaminase C-terminal domain-containing protein [Desulfosarcina sp.]MDX2489057.1 adenine deaminase C-terminal domain-containing protein [Desulfosarcina sp.]
MNENQTKKLIDVALGRTPGDLAIVNARLLNVYTGEILDNQSVCTCGERIACVGPDVGSAIGDGTTVIDAGGATLIPGFIDGHAHVASSFTAGEFLKYAARGGTTTIVTETLEPYAVAGIRGVLDFLASLKDQPIKFFATAPAMVSTSRAAMGIDPADLDTLLARQEIVGLGESYWQAVLQNPDVFLPIFAQTTAHRKLLEGHSAGARGNKLQAYAACGVSSCHEPIKAEEVLDRLRLGIYVMIREGSIRRDLAEIARIKDMVVDTRRLILTTDGISPADLMEMGYMEYLVQKAIDCGFDPVTAVQMATLNVAEHFGLDDRIGGIAPGKTADMVLIPAPQIIQAMVVVSSGRIIARDGTLEMAPRKHVFAAESLNTIRIPKKYEPSDFDLPFHGDGDTATVRVIEMVTDLVTREMRLELGVSGGKVQSDAANDLVKIAAIDRANLPGSCFTGLIKGFGLQSGAMACSAAWDTACVVVVGADETDMALCVNRIREMQGGAVVCNAGRVAAELAMPVFGLISELPLEELVARLKAIRQAAADLGVSFPDPLLTLIALTGAAIPFLRICEEGLVNFKDGRTVDLFVA